MFSYCYYLCEWAASATATLASVIPLPKPVTRSLNDESMLSCTAVLVTSLQSCRPQRETFRYNKPCIILQVAAKINIFPGLSQTVSYYFKK